VDPVVEELGVSWLAWDERRGIGAAIRAGLRYAARNGYDVVVRVDADGQHGADDIEEIVRPILDARAEVVLGSRYVERRPALTGAIAFVQWVLDGCLSTITRCKVTDSTSGFCALGPHAIRMLAEHHPTGYPEPELRLFLSRNAMRVLEVPVQSRQRLSGRTSLTPVRVARAIAVQRRLQHHDRGHGCGGEQHQRDHQLVKHRPAGNGRGAQHRGDQHPGGAPGRGHGRSMHTREEIVLCLKC
jgi:hypothetical protein